MRDKFTLDVGLALDLKNAFRRHGWSEGEIKKLSKGDLLRDVREVLFGRAEIRRIVHVINCGAAPIVPEKCTVEEHKKSEPSTRWDPAKITLFLAEGQKVDRIKGDDLRKELEGKPVLNACVLDYLLAHPDLIPVEWKGKDVFFWGTIFRDRGGCLCVRFLCWSGGRWQWCYRWVGHDWSDDDPAVVSAGS